MSYIFGSLHSVEVPAINGVVFLLVDGGIHRRTTNTVWRSQNRGCLTYLFVPPVADALSLTGFDAWQGEHSQHCLKQQPVHKRF